jgi:hypothetical protein
MEECVMSDVIKFKVKPHWLEGDGILLAERIALIINGRKDVFDCPEKAASCQKCWSLGPQNDWWLRLLEGNEVSLSYRYGQGRAEDMAALRRIIIWLLCLGPENPD